MPKITIPVPSPTGEFNEATVDVLDAYHHMKATPLCDRHAPRGGARSDCVICAGERLQAALSNIAYMCGPPNIMRCSMYDVHMYEPAVVDQVRHIRTVLEACATLFEEALPKFNWGASALDANAIKLLNDVPIAVRKILKG